MDKDQIILEQLYAQIIQEQSVPILEIQTLRAASENILYDFGGSEDVLCYGLNPNITDLVVVDIVEPTEIDPEVCEVARVFYVEADLFQPVSLPKPGQMINVSKLFRYAESPDQINHLVNNIDKHLLKGGTLRIFEDDEEEDYGSGESGNKDLLPLLMKIFRSKGYTIVKNNPDLIIFRK